METRCVFFAVRPDLLIIIQTSFGFKGLICCQSTVVQFLFLDAPSGRHMARHRTVV
jgi:hypothetical protein